jgi:hypothetical protein
MDFTDILSNIFVSTKNKKTQDFKKEIISIKQEIKQVQENKELEREKEKEDKDYTHKYSISEFKSERSESEKHKSESYEDSSESDKKRSERSESERSERGSESESERRESVKSESVKSESEKVASEVKKYNLRKLILKASEFYKRNIFIINSDETNNLKILSDLLEKLNNMKDVFDIYDKNMTVYTFTENKKNYKMMLLENPYLNFEFNFKNTLKNTKFTDDKKHLVIIDFNLISDLDKILDENLLEQNVHLIVLFNSYTLSPALIDLYKFDKNALIINKKDTLKSIQKRFFSKVIKYIVKDPLLDKDTYTELITDEDLDVKNIIIKNGELRYN